MTLFKTKSYLMHPIFFVTIKITYLKMLVVVVYPNFKLGDIFAKCYYSKFKRVCQSLENQIVL